MKPSAVLTILTLLLVSSPCFAQKAPDKLPVNPAAGSTARIGQKAPEFSLTDTNGKRRTLQEFISSGKTLVLFWFDPDCQVIRRLFQIEKTFPQLHRHTPAAKSSLSPWPRPTRDTPSRRAKRVSSRSGSLTRPILIDSAGTIGRLYGAKSSPHVFVVASDGILKYSGAVDNDAKGEKYGDARIPYPDQSAGRNPGRQAGDRGGNQAVRLPDQIRPVAAGSLIRESWNPDGGAVFKACVAPVIRDNMGPS